MSDTSKKDDQAPLLSPILTAQDRKKRILERRRQSTGFITRAHSMPLQMMRSSPSKRSRAQMEKGSVFSNLGTARNRLSRSSTSRSNLFPDEEQNSVSRFDGGSSSTVQTRLFATEHDDSKSQEEGGGALGKLNDESSKATSVSGNSSLYGLVMQRTADAPAITPKLNKKSRSRTGNPLTPSQRLANQLASPGGFGLLQMLQTVTSPYKGRRTASPDKKVQQQQDEWQEAASLDQILDWTIHPKVRLECHPPTCLPNFCGLDQWNKALQYWQYPATAASCLIKESSEGVSESTAAVLPNKSEKGKTVNDSLSTSSAVTAKQLVNAVRGPDAYIQQLVRSEEGLATIRRRRQWQDAFASLYNTWLNKMDEPLEKSSPNAYFYATNSSSQVVLFRATIVQDEVVPMIVLSTTTKEMRDMLHTRGVTLYMLNGSRQFDESDYDSSERRDSAKKDDYADDGDDDKKEEEEFMVHSDMEALRKAQAFGETAGADVTVRAPSKRSSLKHIRVPPLFLRGHDDCGAFSTIFLNQNDQNGEMWCIMSRMGPFPHAVMKSLAISRQRINEENASIELLGPILPCAIPALVGATATSMRRHLSSMVTAPSDDSGLGTHYFVIQAQKRSDNESCRDENCGLNVPMNNFNAAAGPDRKKEEGSEYSILRDTICRFGERVDVVVWDISRPNVATYKLEEA